MTPRRDPDFIPLHAIEWRYGEVGRDERPNRHSLHLTELLDFRPDQGVIRP